MNKIKPFENYSNTLFDRFPEDRDQASIFVSIVSYRDSGVVDTVRSIFQNAKRPNNIYVSVAIASIFNHEAKWSKEEVFKELVGIEEHLTVNRVEITDEDVTFGMLKSIADSAYNKEMFYMSVASSSEFDPYWDDIIMKSYDSVYQIAKNKNFIFTCIPRYFLKHDDIVDGYVFYTNHRTKVSMQREEKDCAKIPTVGYSDFIDFSDLNTPFLHRKDEDAAQSVHDLINQQKENIDFLKENGFPSMGYRKFTRDEVIAQSFGFSSKFVFGEAKTVLRTNPGKKEMVTEEQNDFMSMINFINSDIEMYVLRWTPVYYLPDHLPSLSPKRKSFLDIESNVEKAEAGNKILIKLVDDITNSEDIEKREKFNCICGIDWENNSFKLSRQIYTSYLCNAINTFVSLHNFSVNENSLHWNRRG